MAQPIQEPTEGREIQGLAYRSRQLFRRPAAAPGAPVHLALLSGGDANVTTATGFNFSDVYPFSSYSDDDADGTYFEPVVDDGDGNRAIQINTPGLYYHEWFVRVNPVTDTFTPPALYMNRIYSDGSGPLSVQIQDVGPQALSMYETEFDHAAFTGAGEYRRLGGSTLAAIGETGMFGNGFPVWLSVFFRSEDGSHDWRHALGRYTIYRISDYP